MTGKISEDPDKTITGSEKFGAAFGGQNYGILATSIATYLASLAQTLANKTINAANNAISGLTTTMFAANVVDTDGTLAANSDTRLPSQKAVKTYADALIAANDAMVFKGATDCSGNPNYPAADRGHTYRVSVAGKIGGASGVVVEAGDIFICNTDATASGDQATVGTKWNVIQTNIDGAVIGPSSAIANNLAALDGTTGKLLKDSGVAASTDGTLASNSDSKIPSEKAVKTYVDAKVAGGVAGVASIGGETGIVAISFGQAVLSKNGSNIVLSQKGGNVLTINGVSCRIPAAGVSLAPTGLTAGSLYYIYAYMNSGTMTLEASTTGHSSSTTAGNEGVEIKTGDNTRTLVGMVRPITGPAFADTAAQRFVRSWFNEKGISTQAAFSSSQNTTSTTMVEISSAIRNEFLIWSDEVADFSEAGTVYNSTAAQATYSCIAFDGAAEAPQGGGGSAVVNQDIMTGERVVKSGLSEGYHYATIFGKVTGGTGTWYGTANHTLSGSLYRAGR